MGNTLAHEEEDAAESLPFAVNNIKGMDLNINVSYQIKATSEITSPDDIVSPAKKPKSISAQPRILTRPEAFEAVGVPHRPQSRIIPCLPPAANGQHTEKLVSPTGSSYELPHLDHPHQCLPREHSREQQLSRVNSLHRSNSRNNNADRKRSSTMNSQQSFAQGLHNDARYDASNPSSGKSSILDLSQFSLASDEDYNTTKPLTRPSGYISPQNFAANGGYHSTAPASLQKALSVPPVDEIKSNPSTNPHNFAASQGALQKITPLPLSVSPPSATENATTKQKKNSVPASQLEKTLHDLELGNNKRMSGGSPQNYRNRNVHDTKAKDAKVDLQADGSDWVITIEDELNMPVQAKPHRSFSKAEARRNSSESYLSWSGSLSNQKLSQIKPIMPGRFMSGSNSSTQAIKSTSSSTYSSTNGIRSDDSLSSCNSDKIIPAIKVSTSADGIEISTPISKQTARILAANAAASTNSLSSGRNLSISTNSLLVNTGQLRRLKRNPDGSIANSTNISPKPIIKELKMKQLGLVKCNSCSTLFVDYTLIMADLSETLKW